MDHVLRLEGDIAVLGNERNGVEGNSKDDAE
jgi:hypothetical protein